MDTINSIKALQSAQSPDILEKLLEIYLGNAPGLIEELESSIRDESCESIRNSAHGLKSASGSIGARKIFELSAKLENMARDGNIEDASMILDEIKQLFPMTCKLLEQEVQRPAA